MPQAHKLVQCVAIENTLKILKNTHAPRPQAWGVGRDLFALTHMIPNYV